MKWAYRCMLWLLGVAIPVFLAACYGMPYRFSKTGKVVDRATGDGIYGLKVSCPANGYSQSDYTNPDGSFTLFYDTPCERLEISDTDGDDNGRYQDKAVPFCDECAEQVVELERVK